MVKESKNEMRDVSKRLVGCDIVLDPVQSGMFFDPISKIHLSYFDGCSDRYTIVEGVELTKIIDSIHKGLLRVYKNNKDVTSDFGGEEISKDWRRTKIVDAPKLLVDNNKSDKALAMLLKNNKVKEVCRNLSTVNDLSQLERLLELELLGKNPSFQSRSVIIDFIKDKIKGIYGVGMVRNMDEEKKDVVTIT